MDFIPFNRPPVVGDELEYIAQVIENHKISGDGAFTQKCNDVLQSMTGAKKALLTTSCTHALEMGALLCGVEPGDEVIMPSFTFVSTANAFALRGAHIQFVDIRPDTMNMDETLIEAAITEKTRAIVPVHYAGVACEMDKIMDLARQHSLMVVEDAAQAVSAYYKEVPLGRIGDIGCFSFHETKNLSMGEGGALLIRDSGSLAERAEIIREKGTDRSRFLRGQVDKYSWVDIGSSYLPSELNAAYLYAQLQRAQEVNSNRLASWNLYREGLEPLRQKGLLALPEIPEGCRHNAHMFYVKAKNLDERDALIAHLKQRNILSVFHYVPLHSSVAGRRLGSFVGQDRYTTAESNRLLRLPLYYQLSEGEVDYVVHSIYEFFGLKE